MFCYYRFYLEIVVGKFHDLRIDKNNKFVEVKSFFLLIANIFYFGVANLDKKLFKTLETMLVNKLIKAVVSYILNITFTRISCI